MNERRPITNGTLLMVLIAVFLALYMLFVIDWTNAYGMVLQ